MFAPPVAAGSGAGAPAPARILAHRPHRTRDSRTQPSRVQSPRRRAQPQEESSAGFCFIVLPVLVDTVVLA